MLLQRAKCFFLSYHQFTVLHVSNMVKSNFELGFTEHANKNEVRRFYISLSLCYALSLRKYPTVV
jgi:hypothetical protein